LLDNLKAIVDVKKYLIHYWYLILEGNWTYYYKIRQMYKIYIGEVPVLLVSKEESDQYKTGNLRDMVVRHTLKRRKKLHQIVDNLEKGTKSYDSILVISEDLPQLKEDFFTMYKIHRAGGGVVFNEKKVFEKYKKKQVYKL